MPVEGHKSRRALLRLFGSAPALAILPAAASPSTATLTALIEARREAWAAFGLAVDALEAAEPDKSILVPCLAREPTAVKARTREELINLIEENFEFEVEKLNLLLEMSTELGRRRVRPPRQGARRLPRSPRRSVRQPHRGRGSVAGDLRRRRGHPYGDLHASMRHGGGSRDQDSISRVASTASSLRASAMRFSRPFCRERGNRGVRLTIAPVRG